MKNFSRWKKIQKWKLPRNHVSRWGGGSMDRWTHQSHPLWQHLQALLKITQEKLWTQVCDGVIPLEVDKSWLYVFMFEIKASSVGSKGLPLAPAPPFWVIMSWDQFCCPVHLLWFDVSQRKLDLGFPLPSRSFKSIALDFKKYLSPTDSSLVALGFFGRHPTSKRSHPNNLVSKEPALFLLLQATGLMWAPEASCWPRVPVECWWNRGGHNSRNQRYLWHEEWGGKQNCQWARKARPVCIGNAAEIFFTSVVVKGWWGPGSTMPQIVHTIFEVQWEWFIKALLGVLRPVFGLAGRKGAAGTRSETFPPNRCKRKYCRKLTSKEDSFLVFNLAWSCGMMPHNLRAGWQRCGQNRLTGHWPSRKTWAKVKLNRK